MLSPLRNLVPGMGPSKREGALHVLMGVGKRTEHKGTLSHPVLLQRVHWAVQAIRALETGNDELYYRSGFAGDGCTNTRYQPEPWRTWTWWREGRDRTRGWDVLTDSVPLGNTDQLGWSTGIMQRIVTSNFWETGNDQFVQSLKCQTKELILLSKVSQWMF